MRFAVHAHREVTPSRWYRTFIGAFEACLSRESVQTLINFAKTTSNCEAVALIGTSEMTRQVAALYAGQTCGLALPLIVQRDILKDELRAVVNDPALIVPDSVQQAWNRSEIAARRPAARCGELPL